MIRSIRVIFCDQEHGTGDITFPNLRELTTQEFLEMKRRRPDGAMLLATTNCDMCTEVEKERKS